MSFMNALAFVSNKIPVCIKKKGELADDYVL